MVRAHPITILQKIYLKLLLLSVPLLRGAYHIIKNEPHSFAAWLSGAWMDALLLLIIILFSVLKWRSVKYRAGDGGILLRQGVIIKSEKLIKSRFITSVTCHKPAIMRILDAESVYIDTEGGYTRHSDMSITVKQSQAKSFCSIPENGKRYRPRMFEILFLSLCVTDTLASAIYAVLTISRAGKIIGRDIITEFIGYISGAAIYIAIAVACMEIIGIFRNFLYFSMFSVVRSGESLYFENGFFSKTRSMCRVSAINYIDRRQNLISAMLRLNMVFIQCTGYGKARKKEALLIPAASERSAYECIKMLLPELGACISTAPKSGPKSGAGSRNAAGTKLMYVKPLSGSFMRYVRTPLIIAVLIVIAGIMAVRFVIYPYFTEWVEFSRFTIFMIVVPFALLAVVRVTAFRKSGIFYESDGAEMVTMCYYKGMNIHTVTFRASRVSHIIIKQTIFQARKNICDVVVYTGGEGGHRHTVIGVERDDSLIRAIEKRL